MTSRCMKIMEVRTRFALLEQELKYWNRNWTVGIGTIHFPQGEPAISDVLTPNTFKSLKKEEFMDP